MTWVDIVVVVLCVGIALLEARRGFFAAALNLAALIAVAGVAVKFSGQLTASLSPGVAFLVLYVLLGAAAVTGANFASHALKLDIGPFDHALAGAVGIASGVAVSYALCEFLNLSAGGTHPAVAGSLLGAQVHEFRAYHSVLNFLRGLGE